jgi:hypothetical protein
MKIIGVAVLVFSFVSFAFAVKDVVTATHGTVAKIDNAAQTIAIKTADGTEHVLHWTKDTALRGAHASDTAGKESWHGLQSGSALYQARNGRYCS